MNMVRKPFLPSDRNRSLERAIFACALAVVGDVARGGPEGIAKRIWGEDRGTAAVLKAAVAPANTTTSTWAAELANANVVGDFVTALAPISAGAKLLITCPLVSLDGISALKFPARNGAVDANAVLWVSESAALPVVQLALTTAATLGPTKKLATQFALTRELFEHSEAETVLTTMLRENVAFSLDASLFSNTAASSARPAGLMAGVSPLTASAAGQTAMQDDLEKLASAIAAATLGLTFICHPNQANAILLKRGATLSADIVVWPTLGVPAKTVIALDPAALASAFGPVPEIRVSAESVMHMESVSPQPLSISGSPNQVSAPMSSLWQTDCVAIRLILRCAWAWRTAGAVAWIQSCNWG